MSSRLYRLSGLVKSRLGGCSSYTQVSGEFCYQYPYHQHSDSASLLSLLSTFHTLPVVAFGLGLEVEPDLRLEPDEVFFDDPPYDPDDEGMPR